jgi:hypothetical protein
MFCGWTYDAEKEGNECPRCGWSKVNTFDSPRGQVSEYTSLHLKDKPFQSMRSTLYGPPSITFERKSHTYIIYMMIIVILLIFIIIFFLIKWL